MKMFSDEGCNATPNYDLSLFSHHSDEETVYDYDSSILHRTDDTNLMEEYESRIQHFND